MNTTILNSVSSGGSMSVAKIRKLIASELSASGSISRKVVDALPAVSDADPNIIYFVKRASVGQDKADSFDEYLLVDSKFELIGNTLVNFEGYATEEQVGEALSAAQAAQAAADACTEAIPTDNASLTNGAGYDTLIHVNEVANGIRSSLQDTQLYGKFRYKETIHTGDSLNISVADNMANTLVLCGTLTSIVVGSVAHIPSELVILFNTGASVDDFLVIPDDTALLVTEQMAFLPNRSYMLRIFDGVCSWSQTDIASPYIYMASDADTDPWVKMLFFKGLSNDGVGITRREAMVWPSVAGWFDGMGDSDMVADIRPLRSIPGIDTRGTSISIIF